jgi:hypothetical protein
MMNKNKTWNTFAIVVLVVVITGCAKVEVKTLPPLDSNTAAEESAVFIIPNGAKVTRIDGAKRGLFSAWAGGSKAATLLVPAGEHAIIFECSNPQDGWTARNLECMAEMSAGKMYMLSFTLAKKGGGMISTAFNEAASFVRDEIIDLIPFVVLLPRSNPEGVVYQINEISQTAFDQYLLEKAVVEKKPIGLTVLIFLVGVLWFCVIGGIRLLGDFWFMGKFTSRHEIASWVLGIGLPVAGFLLFNNNSSGAFSVYLISSLLMGFGSSRWDFGSSSAKSGYDKLNKNDYDGAVSDYSEAIKSAPFTAKYFNNRGFAYSALKDWEKAVADLTEAVRLVPNEALYKNNLAYMTAEAAKGRIGSSPAQG